MRLYLFAALAFAGVSSTHAQVQVAGVCGPGTVLDGGYVMLNMRCTLALLLHSSHSIPSLIYLLDRKPGEWRCSESVATIAQLLARVREVLAVKGWKRT